MEETRLFFFSGKKLNRERDSPVQSKYDERIIPSLVTVWCFWLQLQIQKV